MVCSEKVNLRGTDVNGLWLWDTGIIPKATSVMATNWEPKTVARGAIPQLVPQCLHHVQWGHLQCQHAHSLQPKSGLYFHPADGPKPAISVSCQWPTNEMLIITDLIVIEYLSLKIILLIILLIIVSYAETQELTDETSALGSIPSSKSLIISSVSPSFPALCIRINWACVVKQGMNCSQTNGQAILCHIMLYHMKYGHSCWVIFDTIFTHNWKCHSQDVLQHPGNIAHYKGVQCWQDTKMKSPQTSSCRTVVGRSLRTLGGTFITKAQNKNCALRSFSDWG